jgi:hypothetical protein
MSSERKTITINPELFTVGGTNTTRKKRPTDAKPKDLKIKSSPKPAHNTKTLRNRLLNYIRKNQEDNFKKLHGKSEITMPNEKRMHITETFNGDFEESLRYMKDLADKVEHTVDNNRLMNQTLRNYKSLNPESILSDIGFDQAMDKPSSIDIPVFTDFPPITSITDSVKIKPTVQPQWGCMRGGKLPTYRMWKNQTQHHRDPISQSNLVQQHSITPSSQVDLGNMPISAIGSLGASIVGGNDGSGGVPQKGISILDPPTSMSSSSHSISSFPPISLQTSAGAAQPPPPKPTTMPKLNILQMNQIRDKTKKLEDAAIKHDIKYGKRKKTIRRTYKLGRSRTAPKIGVLISNKTVRKNISTKTEKLKQIPIDEIRSVLIKKGFIKVGSLATNDVLRKMYESMLLVCGEVENHNPDNLVYNYFNAV